jgi:heme/copper-type cytochrome/quinol oxidase subunit 4
MSRFTELTKKFSIFILLLFPLFYFFAGAIFRFILEDPSLRSIDPDYVYFMTGLNISEGYLKVKHIDHPGSPLQYLCAAVFRIVWLFRKNPAGFTEDILSHADLYLSMVNLAITVLVSISLFITGKYVYKKTDSIIYGTLIQTLPFISVILYEIIGRITPELLLPLPMLALSAFFIGHISSEREKFRNSELVLLGLILAFGLSLKLTLIPLWVIPLIVVKSWRGKILVLVSAVVFFLVIAFPVTLQIERFWHWTKDLFLHSGQYGSGEENIVDFAYLLENFGQILRLQKHFSYLVAAFLVLIPLAVIWLKKRQTPNGNKLIAVSFAVVAAILAQIIISGKHYAPRYFMPALMFGPLLIFLAAEILKTLYPVKILKALLAAGIAFFLVWNAKQQLGVINYTAEAYEKQIAARNLTRNMAETFQQTEPGITIIVSQDYGCPFPEYALHFSTVWSAPAMREKYLEKLAKLYPNTYQYTTWDGRFIYWTTPLNLEKIISENIPVYIYLENNNDDLYGKTIAKLKEVLEKDFSVQKKLLFENPVNGEGLLQLIFSNQPSTPENMDKPVSES